MSCPSLAVTSSVIWTWRKMVCVMWRMSWKMGELTVVVMVETVAEMVEIVVEMVEIAAVMVGIVAEKVVRSLEGNLARRKQGRRERFGTGPKVTWTLRRCQQTTLGEKI